MRTRPILQEGLPRNTSVGIGENATLRCVVVISGTLPHITWYKWKTVPKMYPKLDLTSSMVDPIYTGITSTYEGKLDESTTELTIVNVTEEDLGVYTCCASNQFGLGCGSAFLSRKKITTPTSVSIGKVYVYQLSYAQRSTSNLYALPLYASVLCRISLLTINSDLILS